MSRYLMNLRQTGQGSGETDSTEAIVAKQESIVFGIAGSGVFAGLVSFPWRAVVRAQHNERAEEPRERRESGDRCCSS